MGTLIDCAHADSVHSFIREGESKGQLLLDGRNAELAAAIGPTIFVDVDPNASLSREEIFGPVLVVTLLHIRRTGATACQRQPVRTWRGSMDARPLPRAPHELSPESRFRLLSITTTTAI